MNEQERTTNTGSPYEEGALKVSRLTPMEVIFTIVGCGIGSGCLGTAYSARLAGFPVITFWLIVSGITTLFSMYYVAETALRTRKLVQLPGLAERYVGPIGKILIFLAVTLNSFSCLIAYFDGSADIINSLLGVPGWVGTLMFLIPGMLVVWMGLKAVGMAGKYLSIAMALMLIILCGASLISKDADLSRLFTSNWSYAIPIFNVAAFSYIGQYLVPDLARGLSHDPKKLAPAMLVGQIITAALLILVPLGCFAMSPADEITEVATIAWGQALGSWAMFVANIFALCAMMTSYWAVGGSMLTNIVDMFKFKSENHVPTRLISLACVALPPFILAYSGLVSFVDAIYLAGTFGGVIMSILPALMVNSARKNGDMEPPWKCGWYSARWVQVLIITLFCAAALYAVLDLVGILPSGW